MTQHHKNQLARSACPVDRLEWFVNHTLSAEETAVVEAHLVHCTACRAEVAAWAELRCAMQDVRAYTPAPRADLFAQIERKLDLLPEPAFWVPLSRVFVACRMALAICAEHVLAQVRLLRRDLFWLPLFIIPVVISMVYLPGRWQQDPNTAALLAALFAALGMAFLYGQKIDPAHEIVLATRTSPRLVLGIRCGLVLGYNLLLNCGLVLPLLVAHGMITPSWFLANWLAPLCCLCAIALLLSILANAGTAVLACLFLWGLRLLRDVQIFLFGGNTQTIPEAPWQRLYESFWHQGPLLFVVTALLVFLTFAVLERKERFAR